MVFISVWHHVTAKRLSFTYPTQHAHTLDDFYPFAKRSPFTYKLDGRFNDNRQTIFSQFQGYLGNLGNSD